MAHFKLNLETSTRVIRHMEPIVDAQQKQLRLSSAFVKLRTNVIRLVPATGKRLTSQVERELIV